MQVVLDDYAPGAELAADLANTSPRVWRGEDRLPDAHALTSFLQERAPRLLVRAVDADDLAGVLALRTPLRSALESASAAEAEAAATSLTGGVSELGLAVDAAGRRRWTAEVADEVPLADRVGLLAGVGLLGVLRTLGVARFRACGSPVCAGVFVDVSRSGRRRYCMPDLCGNRIHVAAHRARRRAAAE